MSENKLTVIENNLNGLLKQKQSALPENFNQTRFLQNCMYVLSDVKNIDKMEPMSVARTMLKGAFLDLDFFNGECYAIPYDNQLNFQTDYKGERKLAKLYSITPIKEIYALLIHKDDPDPKLEIIDGVQHLIFKPSVMKFGKDSKEIKGVLGVILYKDDSYYYEVMSIDEVEHIRKNYSKAPNSPAWVKMYGEMVKKTMIRRLCKNINLQFKSSEQDVAWQDGGDAKFDNYEDVTQQPIQMPRKKSEPVQEAKKPEADKPAEDLDEIFKTMKEYIALGRGDDVKKKMSKYNFSNEQKQELERLINAGNKQQQRDKLDLEEEAKKQEIIDGIKQFTSQYNEADLINKTIPELEEILEGFEK